MTLPRILLVVGANIHTDVTAGPRRDYAVLAQLLDATIVDRTAVSSSIVARALLRTAGLPPALAWLAFRRRADHAVIVTDGEHIGIPLALLLRLARARVKHVTIGHRLSSPKKRIFFRLFGAHKAMSTILLHSTHQHHAAVRDLGIPAQRLALVPYQVDTMYWSPLDRPEEPLIVAAGLEHRDYATLFRAVDGLPVRVVVGAASLWSRQKLALSAPPANVELGAFDYTALRELYARAALVVVPLADVDNQAGVTTILEAMAMGKAVVVTQSIGQTDVIEDRRTPSRGLPRPRPVSLTRTIAAQAGIAAEATGFYVPPRDAEALRKTIVYLIDHPTERAQLGRAARRTAEQLFSVELFAERVAELVRGPAAAPPARAAFARVPNT